MKPILYASGFLLLSIALLLGLPHALNFTQTKIAAQNIPSNQVLTISGNQSVVAGVQKTNPHPQSLGLSVPELSATSALIEDLNSNTILFVKDPNKRVPIASTTKIMTALVASQYFQTTDILTVPSDALVSGSTMGLKAGEKLTVRSLLYGLLLNSGNDAAYTLAMSYPGGVEGFVKAMNDKIAQLGLLNTHFDNPAGFDSPNHFSSALDLSKIAILITESPQLSKIVATKEMEVASVDKTSVHELKNLNKLLNIPGVMGIKTGTTPAAKENLVGLVEKDGHLFLTVVLGSNDRFLETEKLLNWVQANFQF
ncbi:D-alanyl-D-alanine carboxypeptidase [Candidatus Daviesbacteria bacterium]|nr:D-alanyl-D-alanine carboxypeptidase [Candidatus Daviesbacteria bacterium]